jgi:Cu/Ag efflux protein CusF
MKRSAFTPLVIVSIAALFSVAACVPRPPPPTVETTVIETPTGAEVIETIQVTATVAGINYDTRQVVLLGPGGREFTYKVDKSAINFDQIKVRDLVKATITEKLAVYLSKDKAPPSAGAAAMVALAPKGAMPGGVVASTSEVTATVKSVDAKTRKVTLQFVDGSTDTVTVGKAVDLSKVSTGDTVTARLTESIAIAMEKT